MTMEVRVLDHQNHRFSFSGECPHCRRQTVFMPVAGPHRETLTGPNEDRLCAAMQCQGCYKYIHWCPVKCFAKSDKALTVSGLRRFVPCRDLNSNWLQESVLRRRTMVHEPGPHRLLTIDR